MTNSGLLIRKKIEWINTLRPPVTQKVSIEEYDETIEMQAYEVSAFKKGIVNHHPVHNIGISPAIFPYHIYQFDTCWIITLSLFTQY